jgi:hypothetical protein
LILSYSCFLAELKWDKLLRLILLMLWVEAFAIEIHKWHLVILEVMNRMVWAVLLRAVVSLVLWLHVLLIYALVLHRLRVLGHLVEAWIVDPLVHDPFVVDPLLIHVSSLVLTLLIGCWVLSEPGFIMEPLMLVLINTGFMFIDSWVLKVGLVMPLLVERLLSDDFGELFLFGLNALFDFIHQILEVVLTTLRHYHHRDLFSVFLSFSLDR